MKVNFNLTDLKIIKHQSCKKCVFDKISTHQYCGILSKTCLVDSQVFVPVENSSDVFRS